MATTGENIGPLAVFMTLATAFGYAIKWTVDKYTELRTKRRMEVKEDEATQIERIEKLLLRQDEELKVRAGEIKQLQQSITRAEVGLARAVTWIRLLQNILERENVPHPKWTEEPTGDTADHAALKENEGGSEAGRPAS